jgi:hypothetical protein
VSRRISNSKTFALRSSIEKFIILIFFSICVRSSKGYHLRTDYDDEDVILFLGGVLIAGFVSGVISEVSSHYSSIFEEMPHPPIKY